MSRSKYPYEEGDTIVLGPEIFVSADGSVICWKGTNYVPQGTQLTPCEAPAHEHLWHPRSNATGDCLRAAQDRLT